MGKMKIQQAQSTLPAPDTLADEIRIKISSISLPEVNIQRKIARKIQVEYTFLTNLVLNLF